MTDLCDRYPCSPAPALGLPLAMCTPQQTLEHYSDSSTFENIDLTLLIQLLRSFDTIKTWVTDAILIDTRPSFIQLIGRASLVDRYNERQRGILS